VRRGPSEAELARARLDVEARRQARVLTGCDDDELVDLLEEMVDLPGRDMSLQLPLPRLLSPDLERLGAALAEGSAEDAADALPAAMDRVDSPVLRLSLARAVLGCRDAGRVDARVAAAAVLDLAKASSSRLLRASLIEALAVGAGAARTPSGLLVAAR